MGRFDALTHLDEKQQELKPPATPSPISSQKEQHKEVKKPANPQAGLLNSILLKNLKNILLG
jgi:hypothetical protein